MISSTVPITLTWRCSPEPPPQLPLVADAPRPPHNDIPMDIVSDRGPQFTSQVWRVFCGALGATSSLSSGFHPQSNGQSERANQQMEAALRCITHASPTSWSTQLPWVEYANNTLVNASMGLPPCMASLGYQPPLFPELEEEIAVPSVQTHLRRCRRIWTRTRSALIHASSRSQIQANKHHLPAPQYAPGQRVWLRAKDLPLKGAPPKLSPHFIGPLEIERIINPCAVRLRLPPSLRVHPTFHVSHIKPVSTSPLSPTVPPPPPPRVKDNHPAWTVHLFLDVQHRGRGHQYLVDWEGYGPEERSWVPRNRILDPSLIRTFTVITRPAHLGYPTRGFPPPGPLHPSRSWTTTHPLLSVCREASVEGGVLLHYVLLHGPTPPSSGRLSPLTVHFAKHTCSQLLITFSLFKPGISCQPVPARALGYRNSVL